MTILLLAAALVSAQSAVEEKARGELQTAALELNAQLSAAKAELIKLQTLDFDSYWVGLTGLQRAFAAGEKPGARAASAKRLEGTRSRITAALKQRHETLKGIFGQMAATATRLQAARTTLQGTELEKLALQEESQRAPGVKKLTEAASELGKLREAFDTEHPSAMEKLKRKLPKDLETRRAVARSVEEHEEKALRDAHHACMASVEAALKAID